MRRREEWIDLGKTEIKLIIDTLIVEYISSVNMRQFCYLSYRLCTFRSLVIGTP